MRQLVLPIWLVAIACGLLVPLADAQAQRILGGPRRGVVNPDGSVGLPYVQSDGAGGSWIVYDGGWIRQNNPQPVYAQAEMLTINGAGSSSNTNMAQIDPKTGELIIDNLNFGNCVVTRRILIDKDDGWVRYLDVIKNPDNQAHSLSYSLQSTINFGVTSAVTVSDPRHHENQIGWVAQTNNSRVAVEMYGGKGAKITPTITCAQGSNVVQAAIQTNIGPGKSVAVMHLLCTTSTVDQGQQAILSLKESKLPHSIPPELKRQIINFPGGLMDVGDYEILRGDAFDVVELRVGDQMQGTLADDSFKLTTVYGPVELPRDQVICIINMGQFRPRQLVVTRDGQVFGGQIQKETIALKLSSGQVIEVPLSQITRVGYRKRADEPDEWTLDKPYVLLRSGDRMNIEMPTAPIEADTRYGRLRLDPSTIASIAFVSEDNGVHEIYLTDGSRFAGLVDASQFEVKLTAAAQPIKLAATSLVRLQLSAKVNDPDDTTPTLTPANQDLMVGTLVGQLKLDTAFDTVQLNAPEIRRITHAALNSPDVQVTLWDNTTVSGELEEQSVQCQLNSGATVEIPTWMLGEYNQPLPQPSAAMIEKIKGLVTNLSADDWKVRDQTESALVALGPPVMRVLKDVRSAQPPEAQARIDDILKQLVKNGAPSGKS
jgi:hypothetical protein